MNDESLARCADHGGDHGLSCGFWAKYPNLLDEHIGRVHMMDSNPMEYLTRDESGAVYYDFFPHGWPSAARTALAEDFVPEPVITELRKRPMRINPVTNIALWFAAWVIGLGLLAVAGFVVYWFISGIWTFGG